MDELTKKEEMEDKKSARRAPLSAGASFSQDRGRRCNSGNFPKGKIYWTGNDNEIYYFD